MVRLPDGEDKGAPSGPARFPPAPLPPKSRPSANKDEVVRFWRQLEQQREGLQNLLESFFIDQDRLLASVLPNAPSDQRKVSYPVKGRPMIPGCPSPPPDYASQPPAPESMIEAWHWQAPMYISEGPPYSTRRWTKDSPEVCLPGQNPHQPSHQIVAKSGTPSTAGPDGNCALDVEPEASVDMKTNLSMETPDYVERQRHGNRRPSMLELWPKKTSISVEHMVGPDEEDHWFKSSLGNLGFRQIVSCLEWWNGVKEPPRSGMLHGIVSSQWFDVLTAFIIFLNSASTAALSDWELKHVGSELPTFFMVIELAFIAYYLIEFLLKLSVHKHYFFCNDDMAWNWFDLVVLAFSLFDQFTVYFYKNGPSNNLSFARSFRIFRIARILRMFRLIHMLRELRTMMESILGSFVSLFWSFVMIGLILYIFALMFCQAVASRLSIGVDEEYERELYYYFGSVRGTTLTLYECTTGGVDWHDVYKVIRKLGLMHTTFFLFYITFWTFAVVNILTGIFVDSAMRIAAPDRDAEILQQRRKDTADSEELKAIMREALLVPEEVGDAFLISKELFAVTLKNPKIHGYLATLGLDVKDVDLFFDTLAANSGEKEMRIDEFVAHAIRMKGLASSIDVQGLAIQMRMLRNQVDTLQKCTAPPPRSVGRTSLSSTVTAKSNCTPHGQLH